jgi:hypothetical protein
MAATATAVGSSSRKNICVHAERDFIHKKRIPRAAEKNAS